MSSQGMRTVICCKSFRTLHPDPEDPATELIRTMPPNRDLKPNVVDVFVRWVMNGMPRTAEDAAKLYVPPTAKSW